MEQANQTTSIADGLLVPHDFLVWAVALVLWLILVFLDTELLVCVAHGEDEKESMGRPRNEGKELGIVYAKDVMECELVR